MVYFSLQFYYHIEHSRSYISVNLFFNNSCQSLMNYTSILSVIINEPVHEISNNLVCATSKASDQPAHTRSLIRAFVSSLSILCLLSY